MNTQDRLLLPQQSFKSDASKQTSYLPSRAVTDVFGLRDTTPWAVLWLAFAWAAVEVIPGSQMLLSDFNARTATGDSIPGAFLVAASIAAGAVWIWWTVLGCMSRLRQWQIFFTSAVVLVVSRFLLPEQLVSLLAVFAWTMLGVAAVALAVRYLLNLSLEPTEVQAKSDLTIWLLLRYTLAAALLAWFTRSIANDENALLSTIEIVAISLPLGFVVGLASFGMLWILSRKYRWLYIATLIILILPISAASALFLARTVTSKEILIAAVFAASVSFLMHMLLFGFPLIARGLRFYPHTK